MCCKRAPDCACGAREGANWMRAILSASRTCIAVNPSDMNLALAALDTTVQISGPSRSLRPPRARRTGRSSWGSNAPRCSSQSRAAADRSAAAPRRRPRRQADCLHGRDDLQHVLRRRFHRAFHDGDARVLAHGCGPLWMDQAQAGARARCASPTIRSGGAWRHASDSANHKGRRSSPSSIQVGRPWCATASATSAPAWIR